MQPHEQEKLQRIADTIVKLIVEKEKVYGSSWKDHGGFSAFFNLHRKYSRIEHGAEQFQYDLFKATIEIDEGVDSLMDLIAYALLTLAEVHDFPEVDDSTIVKELVLPQSNGDDDKKEEEGEPGPGYVNQD